MCATTGQNARDRGVWGRGAPGLTRGGTLLCLTVLGLACWFLGTGAVHPRVACAEESLVLERGEKVTEDDEIYLMRDARTQRILYCITFFVSQPKPGDGLRYCGRVFDSVEEDVQPGSGFDSDDMSDRRKVAAGLDYIAYHGFFGDTTMRLGKVTGDAGRLYLTTQLAIYHVLEQQSGDSVALDDGNITPEISEAADDLYYAAMSYADKALQGGEYPERRTALWYSDATSDDCQNVITREPRGRIRVQKASAEPLLTEGNPGYSLEGARFGIYRDEECTETHKIAEIVTDATGCAKTEDELPSADYWIRELTPPKGFAPSSEPVKVHVADGPQTVTVRNHSRLFPISVLLAKVDAETHAVSPRVGASLAGAQFNVAYYAGPNGDGTDPVRSWSLKSDEEGRVCLDADHLMDTEEMQQPFFQDSDGNVGLPLGTLVVTETIPPEGYGLPESHTWTFHIKQDDNGKPAIAEQTDEGEVILAGAKTIEEPPSRGDIEFHKVEEGSGRPMANVVFRVTSTATGESHLVMTDEHGHFSSRATAHGKNTNALDAALDRDGTVDESKLAADTGVWFYGYKSDGGKPISAVNDSRGTFPVGTYRFEELHTSATQGHGLRSFDVNVTGDGTLVDAGTVEDPVPNLATVARDATDQDKYLSREGTVTIEDTVRYSGLTPNEEYALTCTLHRPETGDVLADASGKPYEGHATFTPKGECGEQVVQVELDSLPADVGCIVAYEVLTQGEYEIARHEDPQDLDQTLYIPSMATTLVDPGDGNHSIVAEGTTVLDDTVSYRGLIPGQTYRVEGHLVDRSSGRPLQGADGKEVSSSVEFTPDASEGKVHVSFGIDTSQLGGHQVVAFETLMQEDTVICTHDDLNDADQTVTVMRRLALPNTGSHSAAVVILVGTLLVALGTLGRMLPPPSSPRTF